MIHMREYNEQETKNVKFLVDNQIEHTTIQITETGLKKSILDATAPVRAYLKSQKIHDYEKQEQGPEAKVLVETYILTEENCFKTQTSLYRPETKQGDPRMWVNKVKGFDYFLKADDIFAIIAKEYKLYLINLTQVNIPSAYHFIKGTPLTNLIDSFEEKNHSVSEELKGLIYERMADWQPTGMNADTGIGRAIESILGIKMNASKEPDYKGIELKSNRKIAKDRNTLFSQVPDWKSSRLKTGKEIVNEYGYIPNGEKNKTLHVTLTAQKPNPQKLGLKVNDIADLLEIDEFLLKPDINGNYKKVNDVAVWQLSQLHQRLLTKHKETFWLSVENKIERGAEFFRCTAIEHTKNPIPSQFDILLSQGLITVDLLLCRTKGHGDTYSFKIKPSARALLFPNSEIYTVPTPEVF